MRIRIEGRNVGYDDVGRGRPVLLLHGFPLDRRMWGAAARLLAHEARVLSLDLRGLGESEGSITIDDAADDAARLLDALQIEQVVLGGLSMGGYVALAFARRHPRRLAGLLLANTRAEPDGEEARAGRDEAIATVARKGVAPFAREFVARLVPEGRPDVRDFALASASLNPPTAVAAALAALRDRPDARPHLGAIDAPTIVVSGELDAITPPAGARALAGAIPGAELVVIPGVGHLSALEAPEPFARVLSSLLLRARFRT